jgi:hypothetical protein
MADDYFGVRLGDALAAGAGHIAQGLQRKYELQRQEELRRQQMEQAQAAQNQQMQMGFAAQGVQYDPNNPAASFEAMRGQVTGKRQMEQQGQQLGQMKTMAEIEALRARTAGGPEMEKAPPGYRAIPGGLEPIPGGPAAIKQEEEAARKKAGIETQKVRAQNVISTVDEAKEMVGYTTAGFLGNMLSKVGGSSAADLEGKVKTIQANLGFDRLTQMRAESPTGGALGQVSNIELELLTSAVTSLSQKQSPTQLKENLDKVKTHLNNWMQTVEMANKQGEEVAPAAGGGLSPEKKQRLMELRAKLGR